MAMRFPDVPFPTADAAEAVFEGENSWEQIAEDEEVARRRRAARPRDMWGRRGAKAAQRQPAWLQAGPRRPAGIPDWAASSGGLKSRPIKPPQKTWWAPPWGRPTVGFDIGADALKATPEPPKSPATDRSPKAPAEPSGGGPPSDGGWPGEPDDRVMPTADDDTVSQSADTSEPGSTEPADASSDDEPSAEVGSPALAALQMSLNRALGTNMPEHGVANRATRAAIRTFQRRAGIDPTGVADGPTRMLVRRGAWADGGEFEIPSVSRRFSASLDAIRGYFSKSVVQLNWRYAGSLDTAFRSSPSAHGVYVIIFGPNIPGKARAYVGSGVIKDRLKLHRWSVGALGGSALNYGVIYAEEGTKAASKGREKSMNTVLIPTGLTTNKNLELEFE